MYQIECIKRQYSVQSVSLEQLIMFNYAHIYLAIILLRLSLGTTSEMRASSLR